MTNFRSAALPRADADTPSWREGQNDDLVLAIALAAWEAERLGPTSTTPPQVIVPGWLGGRILPNSAAENRRGVAARRGARG